MGSGKLAEKFAPREEQAPCPRELSTASAQSPRASATMGATHQRSTGYRSGTRDLFSKKFRTKAYNPNLTTFLRTFRVGDMVDVVANPAQQKGMPHKYYHGRTGKVWNISKRCALPRYPAQPAIQAEADACRGGHHVRLQRCAQRRHRAEEAPRQSLFCLDG